MRNCEYCRNNPDNEQNRYGGCAKCGAPIKSKADVGADIEWNYAMQRMKIHSEMWKSQIDAMRAEAEIKKAVELVEKREALKTPLWKFLYNVIFNPLNT